MHRDLILLALNSQTDDAEDDDDVEVEDIGYAQRKAEDDAQYSAPVQWCQSSFERELLPEAFAIHAVLALSLVRMGQTDLALRHVHSVFASRD